MPNDWNSDTPEIKEDAAYEFCKRLDEDLNNIRDTCKKDMKAARDLLRECGDFVNMPQDLPVHVYEDEQKARDARVVIILPEKGKLPPHDQFDIHKSWPCTWTPYALLLSAKGRREFVKRLRGGK